MLCAAAPTSFDYSLFSNALIAPGVYSKVGGTNIPAAANLY